MPENPTQNSGSSAAATTAVSPAVVADAPRKSASKVKTAAAIMATTAAIQAAAVQAAQPAPVKSQQELQDVSTAFLDGLPPTAPKQAAPPEETTAPTGAETATQTEQSEAAATETEEGTTETAELTDPGDDHAEEAFAPDTQAGPKWVNELMDKIKKGEELPNWAPKRLSEIVGKAIEKNAASRAMETRLAELEEDAAALHTREVPPHDLRGELAKVTDPEQLKQQQDLAQRWIDWAASVKPDESGLIPHPTDPKGEEWTLEQVHERLSQANALQRSATAQLDFIQKEKPAKEEARKVLPSLFIKDSEEHKLARKFLDQNPWLESKGDKDAILARLVLGEQVIQKRAKGVHTVDVTTAKTVTPAPKPAAVRPAAVTSAPVRSGNAPVNIKELRERKAAGDPTAQRQIDEAFLS